MNRVHTLSLFVGLIGGTAALSAPPEARPVLTPLWKKTTVGFDKAEHLQFETYKNVYQWIGALYQGAINDARVRGKSLIPPGMPTVSDSIVLYANDHGMVARTIAFGTAFGDKWEAGDLFWESPRDYSLAEMGRDFGGRIRLDLWLKESAGTHVSDRLSHRTLEMSFQSQANYVAFVNDAGLLPSVLKSKAEFTAPIRPRALPSRTVIKEAELQGGSLLRIFGNNSIVQKLGKDYLILNSPCIRKDDRLVIREEEGSLLLGKFDLPKYVAADWQAGSDRALAAGRKWEIDLVKALKPLIDEPHRRMHALHLVEKDGTLIAPTNLGQVFGVNIVTGKKLWTHEYAPLDAKRFPTFAAEWIVVPPTIVEDKYIYAPADFPELLCLNVADGKKVWSVNKGDGLYPFVMGDRVLVIGEKTLRSLNVKDGKEQWKIDLPGLPCGRGTLLNESTYLLPICEPKTWRGTLAMVQVKTGKITEVLKPEIDQPIGNLAVHGNYLISQTLTDIAVFPIRK